jgi:transcriptional regulator with XRE-family HTH domain
MLVRVHAGNLTIQDAADRVGLVAQSWSNWEKGKTPRDKSDIARAIAETFEVDLHWLLYGGALTPEAPKRRDRHGRGAGGVRAAFPFGPERPMITGQKPGSSRPSGGRPPSAPPADIRRPAIVHRPGV